MERKCIFDEYFIDGKECLNDFDCKHCETHKRMEALVKAVALNEPENEQAN